MKNWLSTLPSSNYFKKYSSKKIIIHINICVIFLILTLYFSPSYGDATYLFSIILIISGIYTANIILRVYHPTEVYLMWLAFFFSLYICSIALYMVDGVYGLDDGYLNVKNISELETSSFVEATIQWYIAMSGDLSHELFTIFVLTGLVIIPQLISYLISGIFGCAQTPYFVAATTNFAMLFIIKSICVVCALQLSIEGVRWYTIGSEDIEWEIHVIIQNLYLLLIAFSLAAAYYFAPNGWLTFIQSHRSDAVNKVISFMKRHNYARPPHETQ